MSNTLYIKECGNGWYVQTPTGTEGPLQNPREASEYLTLLKKVQATRDKVVWVEKHSS